MSRVKTATAVLGQGYSPDLPPSDRRSDHRVLISREEKRWRREEQRWARERHRHGNEARNWKVTENKLKEELAELQAKLAERSKRPSVHRVFQECTEPAEQECDLPTQLGNEAYTARDLLIDSSGDLGKGLALKKTDVRPHSPSLIGKRHVGSGNKGARMVDDGGSNLEPRTPLTYNFGRAEGAAESKRHPHSTQPSQDIIDVENSIEVRRPHVQTPQDLPSGVRPLSAGMSAVGEGKDQPASPERSLKPQPQLRHFNEHAYVHNYLRYHHAQWWWQTHGPGRGAANDSPLLFAKRPAVSDSIKKMPPATEGRS